MTLKRFGYLLLVFVVAFTAAGVGALGGGFAVYQLTRDSIEKAQQATPPPLEPVNASNTNEPTSQSLVVNQTDVETTITSVVEQVAPSVVTVVGTIPGQTSFFGRLPDQEVSGSGFFISQDGYIVTNNHVVEDASDLWVILADGTQLEAELVGTDRYADLAVLKTEGEVPATAVLGNSDDLDPGETVIAIGSPLGDFMNSVTVGVVSATGRSIDTGQGYLIEELIQTDAAINQGNSGGPLVSLAGEVIGVNTLVVRGGGGGAIAEGLGFAIPANTVQAVVEQIIEQGYVSRPFMGIQYQFITPDIARMYRLPVEYGVYVSRVVPGSPAQAAGLQEGDIIVSIGEVEFDEDHSYLNTLFEYQPGDEAVLGVFRNGEVIELEITLGEA